VRANYLTARGAAHLQLAVEIAQRFLGEAAGPKLLALRRREDVGAESSLRDVQLAAHESEGTYVAAVCFFEAKYFAEPALMRRGCGKGGRSGRLIQGMHPAAMLA
jgi:hypothetical protein